MIAIVGAGAAGLAAGIFAARRGAAGPIVALDGAPRLGAKILVSGGARCNVTNHTVTERDFAGGNPNVIRRILRSFSAGEAAAFFREIGVSLHEEPDGKLFPDSNRSRTVLEALLREGERRRVELRASCRVRGVWRRPGGFRLDTSQGAIDAAHVVLATGGLSLPKTGSDGAGYAMAEALGHTLVARTPALVPLVLDGSFHAGLAGVAHEAEVTVRAEGARAAVRRGSLLWTHFGVSGPVVLDASRFWHRAVEEGRPVRVTASLLPGRRFEEVEGLVLAQAAANPHAQVKSALGDWLPASVAAAVPACLGVGPETRLSRLTREDRRRLVRGLLELPLPVSASRGYGYAEVTAGGVRLEEVDPAHDGLAALPRTVPGRRDPRRGRAHRRVQLPVGLVHGVGGRGRPGPRGREGGRRRDGCGRLHARRGTEGAGISLRRPGPRAGSRLSLLRDARGREPRRDRLRPQPSPTAASRSWRRAPTRCSATSRTACARDRPLRRSTRVDARSRSRRGAIAGSRSARRAPQDRTMDIQARRRRPQGRHPRRARLPEAGDRLQGHHDPAAGPGALPRARSTCWPSCAGTGPRTRWSPSRAAASSSAACWPTGWALGFVPGAQAGQAAPRRRSARRYALEYGTDTLEIHEDALAPGRARPGRGRRDRHRRHRARRWASCADRLGAKVERLRVPGRAELPERPRASCPATRS